MVSHRRRSSSAVRSDIVSQLIAQHSFELTSQRLPSALGRGNQQLKLLHADSAVSFAFL